MVLSVNIMLFRSSDNHGHSAAKKVSHLPESGYQKSRRLGSFTVRTKITFGYALVLCIPVVGTLAGLIVGNYYYEQTIQKLTTTYQEQKCLNKLQVMILQNRPAKELTPFVQNSAVFRQASNKIITRINHIQQSVTQLETSKTQALRNFRSELQEFQKTLSTFSLEFQTLVQESLLLQRSKNNNNLIKQRILDVVNGHNFDEIIQFAYKIDDVAIEVDKDILNAQKDLQYTEVLRMQIILGSLIASVIAASLLAIFTSQAISRPLESLTNVAQQVTCDANTNLRAPVLTRDEVGTLANALNQLIEWVATYTRELKDTQVNLIQSEKMSSLGQVVAGVAHEINNPINFIYGNITYIERYTQDLAKVIQAYQAHYPNPPDTLQATLDEMDLDFLLEDLIKLVQSMDVGTERIREIVLSLRNFSRIDEAEFKAVDLHEGIDSTLLILQHRLQVRPESPAIEVVKDYGKLPLVDCYPGQLNQVLMNLLVNAIDVLDDSSRQQNKDYRQTQPDTIWISTQVTAKNLVQITITDNGSGIPETVRSRIFDPFFTTKPIGKGTGLGLSITYQIITQKHNGKIWCDSALGKGTKFVIQIPVHQPEPISTRF